MSETKLPKEIQEILRTEIRIEDMTCADCAEKVQKSVEKLPGVKSARINILGRQLTVDADPAVTGESDLFGAVKKHGFTPKNISSGTDSTDEQAPSFWERRKHHILTGASGAIWLLATALGFFGVGATAVHGLYLVGILLAGASMAKEIWASVKSFSLDMNLLMTGAVIGAIFIGEWAEGAMVIFLFALAELIESFSLNRAHRSIEKLMDLAPDRVRLIEGGLNERMVSPDDVPVGAQFLVRPGERIGLDGIIETGASRVDQSAITGEPLLVEVSIGDEVLAGSINGEGAMVLRSVRPASDSTVARIIRLVKEAQSSKAPTQRFIDRFAKVYTPVVFAIAVALTAIPVLAFGLPFETWFYRSLVVLLISCPCAFVIATPVTIVSGLAAAARLGLLIKGGAAMEKAARIKAFAFDKTGTLTVGKPEVVDVIVFDGINKTDLLSMAAAVEKDAGHVLGDAIVTHAKQQGLEIVQATDVQALPGLGAQGFVDGGQILVGSHRLFHERKLCTGPMCDAAKDLESSANNLVFVGDEVEGKGIIVLADTVRENAAESLAELRKAGIEHLAMVSGDNKQAAQAIGQSLGIDEIWAERLPENKVDVIRQMQADYGAIAMVGDGINDAPALAASDIGIAMGAGTDQALETADAALISGELTRLPTLVRLSKKTVGRIKANIAIALGIKGAFMVMAGLGVATLWMAVFADTGASLIVIANGLRMLKYEDPPKA